MKQLTPNEIENAIYGKDGLFERTIKKIEEIGIRETIQKTGKRQQRISTYMRQFYHPEKFDYRPKYDTIKEIADALEIE